MKRLDFPSLFHVNCEVIIDTTKSQRCTACEKHRHSLTSLKSRKSHDDTTNPSSHTSYATLKTPEIVERLHRTHKENKLLKKQISRLRQKISSAIATEGVEVDVDLHNDIKSMANDCTTQIQHSYPEGSFQRLFWEEQTKASGVVNPRARRWHPLFIKWCLYLRHLSGKAYELVRDSGCVQLLSQRTLRDYTHHISTSIGFSVQVDEMLLDVANLEQDINRYVFLIMDEVHIKQDLVLISISKLCWALLT